MLDTKKKKKIKSSVIFSKKYKHLDEIMVVPTLLEAQDVIEMEEIERDLGF